MTFGSWIRVACVVALQLCARSAAADEPEPATADVPAEGMPAPVAAPPPPASLAAPPPATMDANGALPTPGHWSRMRVTGAALGGVGVVVLGAGIGLALVARGQRVDAEARCNGSICPPDASADLDAADHFNTGAIVVGAAGVLALASGILLYVLAPPSRQAKVPGLFVGARGAMVGGSF